MAKNRKSVYWQATDAIGSAAKGKFLQLRYPRYAALLLIEFFLTMLIVAGLLLYLDGRFNELDPPLNFFVFAGIAFAAIHFYNYTRAFRQGRTNTLRRESNIKTLALEFIIFLMLIVTAYVYADPRINILPYPANLAFFLMVLSVPLYFYVQEKFFPNSA